MKGQFSLASLKVKNHKIWIRDYYPITNGKQYIAKAIYKPSYMPVYESKPLHLIGRSIINCTKIPLVWDGGNLTHNGYGVAIITEKLLKDNKKKFTKDDIELIIKKNLGFRKLIFIHKEWGDVTGHVDGMVRFIDRYILVVASYPEDYKSGYKFYTELANFLRLKLGTKYKIIRLINEKPENKKYQGIPSAWGNRINFLQVIKTIFLPVYGVKINDTKAISTFENEGFKVITVRCDKISPMGGVLNCVSWEHPDGSVLTYFKPLKKLLKRYGVN